MSNNSQYIPVIDISPLESESVARSVGNVICEAAQEFGFFYVEKHGISDHVVDSAFDAAKRFFSLPEEVKSEVEVSNSHRGFLRIGVSTMEGYSKADQKESFIWGLDIDSDTVGTSNGGSLLAANRWTDAVPEMRTSLNEYFRSAHKCTMKILDAIAVSLGKKRDFFSSNFQRPTSRGSLIYYPAGTGANGGYGVSPHTDFGCLSLLAQCDRGLQVQAADGQWHSVDPIPGTFVVNVGDLLSRWTNDRFRSVPHCVINENQDARYSVVVFVDPDSQTVIDPIVQDDELPKYKPIDCDTYITGRFDRSFAYRN